MHFNDILENTKSMNEKIEIKKNVKNGEFF
jgi:hypothetical protein